jgi:hypothetical protein
MYDYDKPTTVNDISADHYRFVEKDPNETSYVQLVGETPWSGTIFQYGNLKVIAPETPDGMATLAFTYKIIDTPLREEVLEVDPSFKNYIGAVLQHIITDALETGEYKLGSDDSNDHTSELDSE